MSSQYLNSKTQAPAVRDRAKAMNQSQQQVTCRSCQNQHAPLLLFVSQPVTHLLHLFHIHREVGDTLRDVPGNQMRTYVLGSWKFLSSPLNPELLFILLAELLDRFWRREALMTYRRTPWRES